MKKDHLVYIFANPGITGFPAVHTVPLSQFKRERYVLDSRHCRDMVVRGYFTINKINYCLDFIDRTVIHAKTKLINLKNCEGVVCNDLNGADYEAFDVVVCGNPSSVKSTIKRMRNSMMKKCDKARKTVSTIVDQLGQLDQLEKQL